MASIIMSKNIDAIVASYGGVGTTFLLEFLSKYKKVNHPRDKDGLKHSFLPPISLNKKMKFVYIYGDPKLAAISLFRRNLQHDQSEKILQHANKKTKPIPPNMSLEEYALEGVDRLLLKEHFHSWYDKHLIHSTFFVKYEKLHLVLDPLFEFLEIPKEHIKDFPELKKRTSSLENLSSETKKLISNIYDDFSNEIMGQSDYQIRKPLKQRFILLSYLKPIYIYYLLRDLLRDLLFYLKKNAKYRMPTVYNILKMILGK